MLTHNSQKAPFIMLYGITFSLLVFRGFGSEETAQMLTEEQGCHSKLWIFRESTTTLLSS